MCLPGESLTMQGEWHSEAFALWDGGGDQGRGRRQRGMEEAGSLSLNSLDIPGGD